MKLVFSGVVIFGVLLAAIVSGATAMKITLPDYGKESGAFTGLVHTNDLQSVSFVSTEFTPTKTSPSYQIQNATKVAWIGFSTTTNAPTTTPSPSPPPPPSSSTDCPIAKVVVFHFPGPCKAEITCENGSTFTVNKCLNTLTFISQLTPYTD